jgi:hypothetical protein
MTVLLPSGNAKPWTPKGFDTSLGRHVEDAAREPMT